METESVVGTKVSAEMFFRYSVAVVAATLPPVAMIRLPVPGAMLLPRAVPDMLVMSTVHWFISPLLLSMLLAAVILVSFTMLGPLVPFLRSLLLLKPLVILLRPLAAGVIALLVMALPLVLLLKPRLVVPVPLRVAMVLFVAMFALGIGRTCETE
jgi:hypothetical protein